MAAKDETPVDTRDVLDVLESEAKEFEKVALLSHLFLSRMLLETVPNKINNQDAEIDRILRAFRLNA